MTSGFRKEAYLPLIKFLLISDWQYDLQYFNEIFVYFFNERKEKANNLVIILSELKLENAFLCDAQSMLAFER